MTKAPPPSKEDEKEELAASNNAECLALLEQHPTLKLLPPAALRHLVDTSVLFERPEQRTLLREGEPTRAVFFLLHGVVRVFHRRDENQELLLKLFVPPSMFGEAEILGSSPVVLEYARTVTACRLMRIEAATLRALLKEHHLFALQMLQDISQRFCLAIKSEKNLAFNLLQPRLARLLLDYAQAFPSRLSQGGQPHVELSQPAIARDLNITRQYTNHALRALVDLKFVAHENKGYVLLDIKALERLASSTTSFVFQSKESTKE